MENCRRDNEVRVTPGEAIVHAGSVPPREKLLHNMRHGLSVPVAAMPALNQFPEFPVDLL
jgi:hypothetical protein